MSKAKGGLTSLNDKAEEEGTPPSANARTVEHSSPLLRLRGELENHIFELAMPTNTTIILCADSNHTSEGFEFHLRFPEDMNFNDPNRPLRYKFRPTPPGILATCRELRADALALYYGSNVFYFSDTFFQPRALEAFATAGLAATQHIRRATVSHEISPMGCFGLIYSNLRVRANETCFEFRVTFCVARKAGGLDVSDLRTEKPKYVNYGNYGAAGVCCCTLEGMAEGPEKKAGSLVRMLVQYSNLVNDHETLVRLRAVKGEEYAPSVGARLCLRCRKVKAI